MFALLSELLPDGESFCATPKVSGHSRQTPACNTSLLLLSASEIQKCKSSYFSQSRAHSFYFPPTLLILLISLREQGNQSSFYKMKERKRESKQPKTQ
jgi:hypothetical protein